MIDIEKLRLTIEGKEILKGIDLQWPHQDRRTGVSGSRRYALVAHRPDGFQKDWTRPGESK